MKTPYDILKNLESEHGTAAKVNGHGQVDVHIDHRRAEALLAQLKHNLAILQPILQKQKEITTASRTRGKTPQKPTGPPVKLNVVIQIVGSRGDVQPFVALGKALQKNYGHRVRLATHATFKTMVEDNELEFFNIGGDPAELMAFMVKNPGLVPGLESIKAGDIGRHRKTMYEILKGCWRSCIETGDGMEYEPHSHDHTQKTHKHDSAKPAAQPFLADAIIANPPSFAHIHVAERMGIPLHIFFTMPWSPTHAFPHPLVNVTSSSQDTSVKNYISYGLVDLLTWNGLGDIVNHFRVKYLHLDKLDLSCAPGLENRLHVPHTYCWSPTLIPKPSDWGPDIDVCGFFFLPRKTDYKPPQELTEFLEAGPPPVYIGFGSIVVKDPKAFTKLIFDAVKLAGVRALVSQGWSKFGEGDLEVPKEILLLGDTPHDWLFTQVSAVVHHGGAGTTAAGIQAGRPTVIIPFFGDQAFWGSMVARAGAGPQPTPYKQLTAEKLASAIEEALEPDTLKQAAVMAEKMRKENGVETGAASFQNRVQATNDFRCELLPDRHAVWLLRKSTVKLSTLAAAILIRTERLKQKDLRLNHPLEYDTEERAWGLPLIAFGAAVTETIAGMLGGITDYGVLATHGFQRVKHLTIHHTNQDTATNPIAAIRHVTTDVGVINPPLTSTSSDSDSERTAVNDHRYLHHPSVDLHLSAPPLNADQLAHPTTAVHLSNSSLGSVLLENTLGTGHGMGAVLGALLKFPALVTLGTSQGFHRFPLLLGDPMVRPLPRVTGFHSGVKAAGSVAAHSVADAITGLVMLPYLNSKGRSGVGVSEGVMKGLLQSQVGIVSRILEAVFAIPGYPLDGVAKEIQKKLGKNIISYVEATRFEEGERELKGLDGREAAEVGGREAAGGWKGTEEEGPDAMTERILVEWKRLQGMGRVPGRYKT